MAPEAEFTGWKDLLAGAVPFDQVLVGLLGGPEAPGSPGHVSRHPKFAQEAGLICLDAGAWGAGVLVRVADYAREEYWGERALLVSGIFPRHNEGLSWERRQSKLVELAKPWSSAAGRSALRSLDDADAERLASLLGQAWASMALAASLAESVPAAAGPGTQGAAPRI